MTQTIRHIRHTGRHTGRRTAPWFFGCLLAAALAPNLAHAEGGTITGKVESTPPKFLHETFVYVKQADVKAAPKSEAMDQKGMAFLPHMLTTTVGDTVTFSNHDTVFHNVYSKDGKGYNVGTFGPNQEGKYTFSAAGVYSQLCSIHPEMLAYIFVGQNPYSAVVAKDGSFTIKDVPPGSYDLMVWNPQLKAPDQKVVVVAGKDVKASFSIKR